MMSEERSRMLTKLRDRIASIDLDGAREAASQAMSAGIPLHEILAKGVSEAADIIGHKYENGEYFLSELVVSGEIMKEVTTVLRPLIERETETSLGTVVIGTAKGDLHDIGKNIVASLLRGAQFKVIDLGVDVSPDKFVKAVKDNKSAIVGVSALLTVTMPQIGNVNNALIAAGMRSETRLIVGGAALTQDYASRMGADAYAENAALGVRKCRVESSNRGSH